MTSDLQLLPFFQLGHSYLPLLLHSTHLTPGGLHCPFKPDKYFEAYQYARLPAADRWMGGDSCWTMAVGGGQPPACVISPACLPAPAL